LNKILGGFGFGAQSIMFGSSLIILLFIAKSILRKAELISVGMGSLTFFLFFFQSSFNIIRLIIAASIFLYNIENIEKRKLLRFILFSVLAMSFHLSAVVTIPFFWLYPFLQKPGKPVKKSLFFILVGIVVFLLNPILEWFLSLLNIPELMYYTKYIGTSDKSTELAIKKTILYLPVIIPGLIFYSKCKNHDNNFPFYFSLATIGIIITGLGSFLVTYVDRFSNYFLISVVFLIPIYLKVLNKNSTILFYFGIIFYMFIFWFYIYFIVNDHGTVPYQWIL
jgi:hypothetical protein